MREIFRLLVCCCAAVALSAASASAQYRQYKPAEQLSVGEAYHVEFSFDFWNPSPTLQISSESLGIIGDTIDAVQDLGFVQSRFREMKVVLRPAKKHKFRFEYTPIKYNAETVLRRDLIFNGIEFPIAIPLEAELIWRAYRFSYEYNFIYRDRGFLGLVLETKYTDVKAQLTNALDFEFIHARAPIPAVGLIGRGYVAANIAITGEFTFFKLPEIQGNSGRYFDIDLYGTVNFTDNVGVQGGYRSFDVVYKVEDDNGDLQVKGLYVGGVVRF